MPVTVQESCCYQGMCITPGTKNVVLFFVKQLCWLPFEDLCLNHEESSQLLSKYCSIHCWKDAPVTGEKLCQPRLKCGTRHYWRIAAVGILWKQKKSAKNDDFFTSAEFFCRLFFLPTINFYRRIFLPTFFSQTWTFSIF